MQNNWVPAFAGMTIGGEVLQLSLEPHPDFPPHHVSGVTVEISADDWNDMLVDFTVRNAEALVLPKPVTPARADGLWKTTCFEVFLRPHGSERYVELNLSPSGDWASYRFDSYRSGMREAKIIGHPDSDVWTEGGVRMQEATFDISGEPELDVSKGWDLGLSAVIEEVDGTKSYWALAHAPGPPDFHNPACFAHHLPQFEPE